MSLLNEYNNMSYEKAQNWNQNKQLEYECEKLEIAKVELEQQNLILKQTVHELSVKIQQLKETNASKQCEYCVQVELQKIKSENQNQREIEDLRLELCQLRKHYFQKFIDFKCNYEKIQQNQEMQWQNVINDLNEQNKKQLIQIFQENSDRNQKFQDFKQIQMEKQSILMERIQKLENEKLQISHLKLDQLREIQSSSQVRADSPLELKDLQKKQDSSCKNDLSQKQLQKKLSCLDQKVLKTLDKKSSLNTQSDSENTDKIDKKQERNKSLPKKKPFL